MESIAIIGCGSLGGFLGESLAGLNKIDKMVLVDHDTVEQKNIKNSIYKEDHIGELKVISLKKILDHQHTNTEIISTPKKYIEDKTVIPECDLIIDCRDFVYDRGDKIDIRMYISSRFLIIDCRQDISYAVNHQGKYIERLTTADLRMAAMSATMLIHNGLINTIIDDKLVHKIELDYLSRDVSQAIRRRRMKPDEVFDSHVGENKLVNLDETIQPIIDLNRQCDIRVCLGDRNKPLISKDIPPGQLLQPNDVVRELLDTINLPHSYNSYLIFIAREGNMVYVELLAETGAA